MFARHRLSEARLKTIYRRQASPTWDASYLPAILATPKEAPSISRAFILTPEKFDGREIHLLSTPERNFALLGMYHPGVIGLQEQRMLSPEPCEHPLWSMPGIDRTSLPHMKGVIDVAERLGQLTLLPKVSVSVPGIPDNMISLVFPWSGDLLWALRDNNGQIFLLNWSVKDTYVDFKRPGPSDRPKKREASLLILARHEIEQVYYQDAGIATVRVANEDLDFRVAANLRQLFLHHRRMLDLTSEQRQEIERKFAIAMDSEIPSSEVILDLSSRGLFTIDQCRGALFQAIWARRLRVDLFHPVLIDHPLRPETCDVLDVYAHWFRRT